MATSTDVKPGYKTTEFWFSAITQLGILVGALQGIIPPQIVAIVSVVLTSIYNIGRAIVKKTPPKAVERRNSHGPHRFP